MDVANSFIVVVVFFVTVVICKVTVHPDFTGTVPNFDGVSWENYEVFRDAQFKSVVPKSKPCPDFVPLWM